MSKHTPEPTPPCDCIERSENGSWWADCYCSNRGDEVDAAIWCADENKKAQLEALRAINDDLLEALKHLYALVQGECPRLLEDNHHDTMVRAAIAKATGGDT